MTLAHQHAFPTGTARATENYDRLRRWLGVGGFRACGYGYGGGPLIAVTFCERTTSCSRTAARAPATGRAVFLSSRRVSYRA